MTSLQGRLANRLTFLASELYTLAPRGPQWRAKLARLGLDPGPPVKGVLGWRRLLDQIDRLFPRPAIEPVQCTLGGVPCYLYTPPQADRGVALYFHGGAFVAGSVHSHGRLAAELARRLRRNLVFVDYRLGPEHRHPAAVEDCAAAWEAVLAEYGSDVPGVFLGDSAGGNLVLTTALLAQSRGLRLPDGLVAMSPVVDLSLQSAAMQSNHNTDAMLSREDIAFLMAAYFTQPLPLDDPFASPLAADDVALAALPPLLLQASSAEVLADDARLIADRLRRLGNAVEFHLYDGLPHVWQAWFGRMPEADAALTEISDWVEKL